MIITTQGVDVDVTTTRQSTMPPSVLVSATCGEVTLTETLTFGPNTPTVPTTAEEMQAVLDNFRQELADRAATQFNLLQMLNQIQ